MKSEKLVFPGARIIFDDAKEFAELQALAAMLGMGENWPIEMLRYLLDSYHERDSGNFGSDSANDD